MKRLFFIFIFAYVLCVNGCGEKETTALEISPTPTVMPDVSPTVSPTTSPSPTPSPTPTLSPTPTPTPVPSVELMMIGDILLHKRIEDYSIQEDGSYNFDAIFANTLEESLLADIAIVNQEVILGGEELGVSGYPAFNAPYEMGDALAAAGYDVGTYRISHVAFEALEYFAPECMKEVREYRVSEYELYCKKAQELNAELDALQRMLNENDKNIVAVRLLNNRHVALVE